MWKTPSDSTASHGTRRPGISHRLTGVVTRLRSAATRTIVICSLTVAELAHGIYRAKTPERSRQRRQFPDELRAHVSIHPITEATAEIIARIGAGQAAKGINLPLAVDFPPTG